ncbi:MAG: exopolysaccharide biosynthesis polyprenyl glycosylphosphotransferase [Alphaproteobacteria bacterium]|nr:exopolysaccharide biosynthesis polyprenyl glycosylphosphotransferase [Alphaproteobacteria bacterium]
MSLYSVTARWKQQILLLGDALAALLAVWIGHAIRFGPTSPDAHMGHILQHTTGATLLCVGSLLLVLYIIDAYEPRRKYHKPSEMLRIVLAIGVALVVQMALFYALPNWWWGRGIAGLSSLVFAPMAIGLRNVVARLGPPTAARERTLIVGGGRAGTYFADTIRGDAQLRRLFDLYGFIDDDLETHPTGIPIVGGAIDLLEATEQFRISLVVVTIRGGMRPELVEQLLECKAKGIRIVDMPSLLKQLTGKVPINHLADTWLIFGPGFAAERRTLGTVLRLFDIVLSSIGLLLSGPIIAVACLLIRLDSPGPAFFTQERLGLGEQPFTIIKLRTMRNDAEKATGAVWSQGAGDPRVTRLGRLLRRTRVDELPQFWNVFRGDMSMVGPRPEREHFVKQLKESIPYYGLRFAVKPGLTGWAQVMYRYGASTEDAAEKLRYELYAIQEMSIVLYLLIVLKTVQTVVTKPGS